MFGLFFHYCIINYVMFIKKWKNNLLNLNLYDIIMTMLPRVKGISYGLTKLPTHNYIVSIAFLVHCCVGLFADSPPSQYFDTNFIFSIILWGYPFYIYMCMCVLRVPHRHNVSVHICVGISNLFFCSTFVLCQFLDSSTLVLCQLFDDSSVYDLCRSV